MASLPVVVGEGITSDASEPSIVSQVMSKRTPCYYRTRLAFVADSQYMPGVGLMFREVGLGS